MVRKLAAALIVGGLATLVFGALVPLPIAVPVVVVAAVVIAIALAGPLSKPFKVQLDREREFSANASHQLRTPLAALRLRLEDMTLWRQTDAEQRAELSAAIAEVDRLTGTVSDLLALARGDAVHSESEVLDLAETSASAAARWRPHFQSKGRSLLINTPPEELAARISERSLSQVIDVLLENSLRHGNGITDVRVELDGGCGVLTVGDEGSISGEVASHVFERSYRSPTSSGSGIGLALARELVEAAGAQLRIASTDPTSFELRFPHT